ncbi:MAG: hypothetical protein ACRD32_08450, partial [Nitrososphaerales archaeon]
IVQPVGTDTIQAAGQSWDTYVIGWHYAEDSKVWIKDKFPLPIKAKVFALSTQKPIPVQFQFDLLETRVTDTPPTPPTAEQVLPTPPLITTTTSAIFTVELYWQPVTINVGEPITIGVVIRDQQNKIVENVRYNLKIEDAKGNTVIDKEFLAEKGQGTHEITLNETGRTHITVTVLGSLSGVAEKFTENAEFEIIVVPEFPVGLAVVMASLVAMAIAITRFKKLNIPRL